MIQCNLFGRCKNGEPGWNGNNKFKTFGGYDPNYKTRIQESNKIESMNIIFKKKNPAFWTGFNCITGTATHSELWDTH
jgi:hypothetical protein